jgi:hypothetical protein
VAVPIEISREHLRVEVESAQVLALALGWAIEPDLEGLAITVGMKAYNHDRYLLIGKFDDYKEKPPVLDFLDPDTGQVGTRHAYPKCKDSLFHSNGPCICAPFSRKAYKDYRPEGPHGDWKFDGWMSSRASNIDWINYNTLPAMLGLIQTRLNRPDLYEGRMA